jgi:hypothetical protein
VNDKYDKYKKKKKERSGKADHGHFKILSWHSHEEIKKGGGGQEIWILGRVFNPGPMKMKQES